MNKMWKTLTFIGIAWLSLLFLYPTVSYVILESKTNQLDEQIQQIYKRHFPQARNVIAPQLRLEEKLQSMQNQLNQNRLLLLLAQVSKGLTTTPNVQLKRFDFQNNQLTLEVTAATSEDFSLLTDYLSQQGLSVKQQNANLVGTRVNATVLVD